MTSATTAPSSCGTKRARPAPTREERKAQRRAASELPSTVGPTLAGLTLEEIADLKASSARDELDTTYASVARRNVAEATALGTEPWPLTGRKLQGYLLHYVHARDLSTNSVEGVAVKLRSGQASRATGRSRPPSGGPPRRSSRS